MDVFFIDDEEFLKNKSIKEESDSQAIDKKLLIAKKR